MMNTERSIDELDVSLSGRQTVQQQLSFSQRRASPSKVVSKKKTAVKKSRAKKPEGHPKRPLTAYNFFFQMVRDRLVVGDDSLDFTKEQVALARNFGAVRHPSHRKTHGKIGFRELAFTIGKKWKNLDPQYKALFYDRAKAERQRYDDEVAQWEKVQKEVAMAKSSSGQHGELSLYSLLREELPVDEVCDEPELQLWNAFDESDSIAVSHGPGRASSNHLGQSQSCSCHQFQQNICPIAPDLLGSHGGCLPSWTTTTQTAMPRVTPSHDLSLFSEEDLAFLDNLPF